MMLKRLTCVACVVALAGLVPSGSAVAARARVPEWAKPAVNYLADQGLLDKATFAPNAPMYRKDFRAMIEGAFGGGYSRTKGKVTAGEVGATLVRVLDRQAIAQGLNEAQSPDGWDPQVPERFGTEVVSRELGLRHDRPTDEESMETAADDHMRQADVAWAVWRAMTAPSIYSADALARFGLEDYDATRRKVIRFALSLAGTPYVWGGEWIARTPDGYPYGAQPAGGFDCSGFLWYVLQQKSSTYSPVGRDYKGWSLPERASYDMAQATPRKKRLSYSELIPGDIVFFAPDGRDSKTSDVYHAGLYVGKGWMVHSSGGRAGVSLGEISKGTWWHDQIVFGRRVIPEGS
ncbi:MAG: C40 family peptidase [Actinomycetota bacterium]